jgi:hypothetical protein
VGGGESILKQETSRAEMKECTVFFEAEWIGAVAVGLALLVCLKFPVNAISL